MNCRACGKKTANWLHEAACRDRYPLAWLLFDYATAMITQRQDLKIKAISDYRESLCQNQNMKTVS